MDAKTALEYTINHWEIIFDLVDEVTPLWELKFEALKKMNLDVELRFGVYNEGGCFLCFYCTCDSIERTGRSIHSCTNCPMKDRWPGTDGKDKKYCVAYNSVYVSIDFRTLPPKKDGIKIIIDAFKKRLEEMT